jgi:Fe-S cluster assembly protein SufD
VSTATPAELFRTAFEAALGPSPDFRADLRRAHYRRFVEMGLPAPTHEDWKYTSLAPLARATFGGAATGGRVTLDDLKPLSFGALGRLRVVFVNGRLAPSLSTLEALPKGVRVMDFGEPAKSPDGLADPGVAQDVADPFHALNLALATSGACVGVNEGVVVEEPIHLYFYATEASGHTAAVAYRNLVVLSPRSELKLVTAYGGPAGAKYLTSVFGWLHLMDGAILDHVRLQRESASAYHVARMRVTQSRGSRFHDTSVNLGAALHRHDIGVQFEGEGCECSLDGLFMAGGEQHTDTHTLIDHAWPRCSSRELYKGVLDGKARGVFHGRILVRKDAQKTDAMQTNKNLLLSREALVNSTPQLEILADDVKCKHGSTTGQLDAAALFYLRSRGIGEAAARSLLTYAFASDVVKRIPVEHIRAGLEAYLQARLPVQEAEEAVA